MHKPIQLDRVSLYFPQRTCFVDFTARIPYGSKVAVIGRNGSGKTTLLKILYGMIEPSEGTVKIPDGTKVAYIPQIINDNDILSGGQRLISIIEKSFNNNPDIILMDEPTNHLDYNHRRILFNRLRAYKGTLIIASHDTELLSDYIDIIFHIHNGKINIFHGNYYDYMRESAIKLNKIEQELYDLKKQKKQLHNSLMQEQLRASKSKSKGQKSISNNKWPTIVSNTKAVRAEETSGRKKSSISHRKLELQQQLSELYIPEVIIPKFSLTTQDIRQHTLICINDGCIGYDAGNYVVRNINLSLSSMDRIALTGNNGSGKTTLLKAILGDGKIMRSGSWIIPGSENIGYLDQHYNNLTSDKTVFESIQYIAPTLSNIDIRKHLNDFLFRKTEEINNLVSNLSGGEKARLSLAIIALKTPGLLLLDEITNNIDFETRQHLIEVLRKYPGAMIIISHDDLFLGEIGISDSYNL